MPNQSHLENSRMGRMAQSRTLPAIFVLSIITICCFGLTCCVSNNIGSLATGPVVSLSATSLYFGEYAVGTTGGPKVLSMTNSGTAPLTITSVTVTGSDARDFAQTNNCGDSLAAGANCSVKVTFKPSAVGTRTSYLRVLDNLSGNPQEVILSGTARSDAPVVTLSATSVNFGTYPVGVTAGPEVLSVTNSGNATLKLASFTFAGANAGDFPQTTTCGGTLTAGDKCLVSVTFKPTAAGTRTCTLNISDNAAASPQMVTLSGTATAKSSTPDTPTSPNASLSPNSLTFTAQAIGTASSTQAVTLSNSGTAALAISTLVITGANSSDFAQANNCGSSVAAGASCAIGVTFKPSAAGARTSNLTITDSATGSPQTVVISGTGTSTTSGASLSPTSLAFSNQPLMIQSTSQTVTLANNGSAPLSISGIAMAGANSSDFVQNNNCGSSVAAGASCTIVVVFTPSAVGARTATLSVSDSAAGSPQSVSLSGTGSHDVILSWTASPTADVIGYNIYRGTISGGESSTALNSGPVSGTSYTDSNVTAGVEYYYRVTSVLSNGDTQSSASNEAAATVP